MDLSSEKKSIIERLQKVDDQELLRLISRILDYGVDHDVVEDFKAKYNQEIASAEKEILDGNSVSQEDLRNDAKDW